MLPTMGASQEWQSGGKVQLKNWQGSTTWYGMVLVGGQHGIVWYYYGVYQVCYCNSRGVLHSTVWYWYGMLLVGGSYMVWYGNGMVLHGMSAYTPYDLAQSTPQLTTPISSQIPAIAQVGKHHLTHQTLHNGHFTLHTAHFTLHCTLYTMSTCLVSGPPESP